jgi:hypothetical protein
MSEQNKRAVFSVSYELLRQALHLPDGVVINYVDGARMPSLGTFDVIVYSPDLKEAPEGETPRVSPTFQGVFDESGKQTETRILNWNYL